MRSNRNVVLRGHGPQASAGQFFVVVLLALVLLTPLPVLITTLSTDLKWVCAGEVRDEKRLFTKNLLRQQSLEGEKRDRKIELKVVIVIFFSPARHRLWWRRKKKEPNIHSRSAVNWTWQFSSESPDQHPPLWQQGQRQIKNQVFTFSEKHSLSLSCVTLGRLNGFLPWWRSGDDHRSDWTVLAYGED